MKRVSLALALALVIGLSLVPGTAWAGHRHHHGHHGFAGRCCVFIGPVAALVGVHLPLLPLVRGELVKKLRRLLEISSFKSFRKPATYFP